MIKRFIITLIVFIMTLTGGGISAGTEVAAPIPDTVSVMEDNTKADAIIGTQSFKNYNVTVDGKTEHLTAYVFSIEDNYALEMYDLGYNNFDIYDSQELTEDMLLNRVDSGRIIIERIIGIVENSETGDGKVLNHDYDTYITYKGTHGLDYKDNTIIITYLLYNPDTAYTDDVLERYDFVLSRTFEK